MDGSAVVTTRLSRTTMKSAMETAAKVQPGRRICRSFRACERSLSIGSEYSLTIAVCQGHSRQRHERGLTPDCCGQPRPPGKGSDPCAGAPATSPGPQPDQPAQGTSTESSVGESRATTYSAASASERLVRRWVSRGG